MSEAMKFYHIPGSAATQTFMLFMDRFFDMLNVRSPDEYVHKHKEDLKPFRSPDDARLKVCVYTVIQFFICPNTICIRNSV